MSKRSMILDAFRPNRGWVPKYIRDADPAERWKLGLLRIGAGIVIVLLLLLLGGPHSPLVK